MSKTVVALTTPVGRLVAGSLYDARTVDQENKPLVIKSGPNAGQPRKDYSFGIAIPKTPGVTHWASEEWAAPIWALGHADFPGIASRPDFSWKITDGDSQIPNLKNVKPCDREGYPGNWVLFFSSSSPTAICNATGSQLVTEPNAVKRGYYVQVMAEFVNNQPSQSPGLYANPRAVAFSAYGPEIAGGAVDISKAGFGGGALPAGATAVPVGAVGPAPGAPAPGAPAPGAPAPGAPAPVAPAPVAPAPVAPAPVAPAPVAPAPVAPAPVAPARDFANGPAMSAAAGGVTYEAYVAAGWSDEQMRAAGFFA